MISRIDHISIAVRDYEAAKAFFEKVAGATSGASAEDSNLEYFWHIFSIGDMSRLELIAPTGEDSFLKNFLSDKAGGVHHITMETPDIHETKDFLDANDIPYFGFMEMPQTWSERYIHPRDAFGVLIQIAQLGPDYHFVEPVKRDLGKGWGKRWKIEPAGGGCNIRLHHPGGVELNLTLTKGEMRALARELEAALGE